MKCTEFSLVCLELGDRPIQIPLFLGQRLLLFHLLRELLDATVRANSCLVPGLGIAFGFGLGGAGMAVMLPGNTINGFIPCDSVCPGTLRDDRSRS